MQHTVNNKILIQLIEVIRTNLSSHFQYPTLEKQIMQKMSRIRSKAIVS